MSENQEYQDRLERLERLRSLGRSGYEGKFERSHTLENAKQLSTDGKTESVAIAGRIMTLRRMGKIGFATLQDHTGQLQIIARNGDTPADVMELFNELIDNGDIVGVRGETFVSQRGEPSVMVKELTVLTKALRPLPEKWAGLADQETKYRQRYLDIISDRSVYERFQFRSRLVKLLREFYEQQDFTEIETPILQNTASGALATPFTTHHNALDIDVYLRIAPEIKLKEAIVAGFDRVYEIGRSFRNEGVDPSHLQDFTTAEHYAAYWNHEDNMKFTEEMFSYILPKLCGSMVVPIKNRNGEVAEVDFTPPWPRKTLTELIQEACGISIDEHQTVESLRTAVMDKNIEIENINDLARGNLIDELWKKVARPTVVGPLFYLNKPSDLAPLARRNDNNPTITDSFQLVVNGWEIVNAYSELANPLEQSAAFNEQMSARAAGDTEAMLKDDEFVSALEHGMPPTSGWGMGVDRLVALLTQQPNLRDVVLFPLLKPKSEK